MTCVPTLHRAGGPSCDAAPAGRRARTSSGRRGARAAARRSAVVAVVAAWRRRRTAWCRAPISRARRRRACLDDRRTTGVGDARADRRSTRSTPRSARWRPGRAGRARRRLPTRVIWDELTDRIGEDSTLTWTFGAFMVLADVLAAIGVVTDSQITIVGAMVVGPDSGRWPSAIALVRRRASIARRRRSRCSSASPVAIVASQLLDLASRGAVGLVARGPILDRLAAKPNSSTTRGWFSLITASGRRHGRDALAASRASRPPGRGVHLGDDDPGRGQRRAWPACSASGTRRGSRWRSSRINLVGDHGAAAHIVANSMLNGEVPLDADPDGASQLAAHRDPPARPRRGRCRAPSRAARRAPGVSSVELDEPARRVERRVPRRPRRRWSA